MRHCTVFWHKWPVHDLCKVIKVVSSTRPCSKLGGTTLNGRKEGGQYHISQTCDSQRFEARKVVLWSECLKMFSTGCSLRRRRKKGRGWKGGRKAQKDPLPPPPNHPLFSPSSLSPFLTSFDVCYAKLLTA